MEEKLNSINLLFMTLMVINSMLIKMGLKGLSRIIEY
jgi:hypothetical protein